MALQNQPLLSTTQINCHVIGLDKRGLATLQFFFQKHYGGHCEMVSEDHADMFMVNMDSIGAEKKLAALEDEFPDKPVILLALYPIETEKHYSISKPINAKKLLAIMNKIELKKKNDTKQVIEAEKITDTVFIKNTKATDNQTTTAAAQQLSQTDMAHFIGHREDVDLSNNEQLAEIYFDPKRYYLGHIIEALEMAKKHNTSIQLTGLSHTLYICPNRNLVYIKLSDNKLRYYGVTTLYKDDDTSEKRTRFSYKMIADDQVVALCEKTPSYQQELCAFLWKLTLWTARGRLPKGVDIDMPVCLKVWPNFTRIVQTPHALRISAYWIAAPKTIRKMVESLLIEQRYLFSFFTATYVVGLSSVVAKDKEKVEIRKEDEGVNKAQKNRGIFSRLIKKLTTA